MKAYIFPGQGAQYKGMGEGLFKHYPDLVQQADEILGYSVVELCLEDPLHQLGFTQFTQPALYVVNALSYRLETDTTGVLPDYLAGHSLGEYNALEASGAISFEDGVRLVKKRGVLMRQAPKGAMAAILGSNEDEITQLLTSNNLSAIDIANYNSPDQTVISGLVEDIAKAEAVFSGSNIKFIPLNTSGAFHSRYMESAKREFTKYLNHFEFLPLTIDVISNVDAKPYSNNTIADNLASQIVRSVRWSESVAYMMNKGVTEFNELGVGNILSTLIEKMQAQLMQAQLKQDDSKVPHGVDAINDTSVFKPSAQSARKTATAGTASAAVADGAPDTEQLSKVVDDWNDTYPIGTKVSVNHHPDILETRTEAMMLFDRKATVYMKGYKGYFDLVDVRPINTE